MSSKMSLIQFMCCLLLNTLSRLMEWQILIRLLYILKVSNAGSHKRWGHWLSFINVLSCYLNPWTLHVRARTLEPVWACHANSYIYKGKSLLGSNSQNNVCKIHFNWYVFTSTTYSYPLRHYFYSYAQEFHLSEAPLNVLVALILRCVYK